MTRELSGIQNNPDEIQKRRFAFPKEYHLLRSSDFRRVYQEGVRLSSPYFAAFCLATAEADQHQAAPRIGFTVSRAMGIAVIRNRMKRRMREAVRVNLSSLPSKWTIVFNPRRTALDAPLREIEREVLRVFSRCGAR